MTVDVRHRGNRMSEEPHWGSPLRSASHRLGQVVFLECHLEAVEVRLVLTVCVERASVDVRRTWTGCGYRALGWYRSVSVE
jgi:hypothetical protein